VKWNIRKIEITDIPSIQEQGKILIKAGNQIVEQLRCVFTLENDNKLYIYPLLDFVDMELSDKYTSFFLYQMVT